jgi:hypothetical protein
MKTAVFFLLFLTLFQFASADTDFVSSWTAGEKSQVQYVLRVPEKDQRASFWDPGKGSIPISPEKAIELVYHSDLIRQDKRIWKVIQVQLSAISPLLYSTLPAPVPPSADALVAHYSITVSHLKTGVCMGFVVLMDGRVFAPKLEKKFKFRRGAASKL